MLIINKIKKLIDNPLVIIPSMGYRYKINWFPTIPYLKICFKVKLKYKLDLENPSTFNEKLQWLKIYNQNPGYTYLVDKYSVRKYISKKIGDKYLNDLYGVYDNFDDIDFNALPNKYVIKTTHDSGGVFINDDNGNLDLVETKKAVQSHLSRNYYYPGREWPYKNIKPRIIIEKYLEDHQFEYLKDYKFLCFNGKPKIIQVMSERKKDSFLLNHFNLDWEEIFIERKSLKRNETLPTRPKNLEKMIEIATNLSSNIPFVRVDLFEVNSDIYFGEMTFFPVSGYMDFTYYEDDKKLGDLLKLPEERIEEKI